MKRIVCVILSLFACAYACFAQKMDNEHLSVSVWAKNSHLLNALHIYDKLIQTHDCPTVGVTVGVNTKPSDDNYYAWAYNIPHYGLGFSFSNMGSISCRPGSSLGDAYTLYGYSHFDLVKSAHFTFGPTLEFGASYVTKKWDAVKNPRNSFVGTSVLVMVGAGLEAAVHITPQWEVGVNAMFTHRSNGMIRVPNFGLNEFGAGAFARYDLSEKHLDNRGDKPVEPEYRKWLYDIYFSGGVHNCDAEREVYLKKVLKPGEPNLWGLSKSWLRLNLGGTVSYRYHPVFATGVGLDLSYTGNWKKLAEYYEIEYGQATSTCPVYVGAYVQQSFFYERIEVALGLGAYLFKRLGIEDSRWDYQRVMIRYHILPADDLFVGFAMRAHRFDRSDTLEFSLGKRF